MAKRGVNLIKNLHKDKDLAQIDLFRVRINQMKPNQQSAYKVCYCTVCLVHIIGQARHG